MRYNPQDAVNSLPAGEYDATIIKAEESLSKQQKPMAVITYKVYGPGRDVTITDYIVMPAALWKLKKLAQAIGKSKEFDSGVFNPRDYENANVRLTLEVEENAEFGDQNRVKKYGPCNYSRPVSAASEPMVKDDDIPF